MEIILSYLVVLVAIIALTTPLWVRYVPSKAQSAELEDVVEFIQSCDNTFVLEQLTILSQCRRLLLHIDLEEGHALLD